MKKSEKAGMNVKYKPIVEHTQQYMVYSVRYTARTTHIHIHTYTSLTNLVHEISEGEEGGVDGELHRSFTADVALRIRVRKG